jgi:hypothetical protein
LIEHNNNTIVRRMAYRPFSTARSPFFRRAPSGNHAAPSCEQAADRSIPYE